MNLFTRLPIVVDDSSLQRLAFEDVDYLVDYEPEASGHWIFDKGDSSALTSLSSDKVLTQQGASTYSENYLSMSNLAGNALVTDIPDIALPVDTYCMVIRNPNHTTARTLFGNWAAESGKGVHLILDATAANLECKHGTGSYQESGLSTDLNTWTFIAISRNQPGNKRIYYVGGKAPSVFAAPFHTPVVGAVPLRLGNGFYSGSTNAAAIDYAEFAAFDFALTESELDVVYARAKARMATRGIEVA